MIDDLIIAIIALSVLYGAVVFLFWCDGKWGRR